jgi:hypothetical protein
MLSSAFKYLLCLFLFAGLMTAEASEQSQSFKDGDLAKYRNPSDRTENDLAAEKGKTTDIRRSVTAKEKDYWCKEGMKRAKSVEKAQARVNSSAADVKKWEDAADRHHGDRKAAKRLRNARKKMAKDQKALAKEEAELSGFENRAHRKNIPPGWLKCNTEF